MLEHLQKGICPKCSHYETCQTPCFPVREYLREDNLAVYEAHTTNREGERIDIVYARSRETPESDLPQISEKTNIPIDEPFSTDAENPFSSFSPKLKQTGIFVDRFFNKWSYEDLAVKYNMSQENARKAYHNGVQRVLAVVEAMDKGNAVGNFDPWKKMVEERSGSLPKGQKWFLLNKLLGMRPSQIAGLEGLKGSSSVRGLIIRVSDQLRSGEIRLFESTPEESQEAKARLDAQRKKRREQHARKKAIVEQPRPV